jgi:RHS repeat-associated protein
LQSRGYDSVTLDPIETRWYVYDLVGRTTRVIQAIAGEDDANGQWYRATDLWYDTSGRLWVSRLQRYQLVEVGDPPEVEIDLDTRQFLAAMEYRYDAGRQRYMVRPRDAETLSPPQDGSGDYDLDVGAWHDYSGAAIYGDYAVEAAWDGEHATVTSATVTETLAHEPGMVQYDRAAAAGEEQLFLHGNLVGTTERITDSQSAIVHRAVYTAFGEQIHSSVGPLPNNPGAEPAATRYGYVGAWGYEGNPLSTGQALEGPGGLCDPAGPEAHCDPVALLGWLHVGERYYDPASGRFMQRDPIGIRGGSNTYLYVGANPLALLDPDGLVWYNPFDYQPIARATLWITGGQGNNFLDRWGNYVDQNGLDAKINALIAACGARVPKSIRLKGQTYTSSIWTKVPGISPARGRVIGRVLVPVTIAAGAYDLYVIVEGAVVSW